jgi:hypothetical protein
MICRERERERERKRDKQVRKAEKSSSKGESFFQNSPPSVASVILN